MNQNFPRGLRFHEVAFIKAMNARGYRRDYIMSFLLLPGRTLSPACINDVVEKDRAPDVPPASWDECEALMARRMREAQPEDDDATQGPLSTFAIHQELGFVLSRQETLFGEEGARIEFKRGLPEQDKSLARVLITAAAFANRAGGYVVFGITDDRKVVGVDQAEWNDYDWNKFSARLASLFQPSIDWRCRHLQFGESEIGVVYVHRAEHPPIIATRDWHGVREATIYFRTARSSDRISYGDLFNLLQRRDSAKH